MLVFGTVIATKPHQVRIKIEEQDNFESDWYFVPQLCTVKDKSSNSIAIDTLVAACVSDDLSDGCIIGALYNDEDICIIEDENIKLIKFEDGTLIQYDKTQSKFTLNCTGDVDLSTSGDCNIKAVNVNVDASKTKLGLGGKKIVLDGDQVQVDPITHKGVVVSSAVNTSI